jgi:hypothetical protein
VPRSRLGFRGGEAAVAPPQPRPIDERWAGLDGAVLRAVLPSDEETGLLPSGVR